ncbi:MAG: hypothetical protein P1P82_09290 [Bacteroidales bacterium]|nr:hypothetical protein [Bacteroidales bacterium]MDT8432061.1 hypothetical protein [Bacteroidales bacterium]
MKKITLVFLASFLISCLSVYGQKVQPGAVVGFAKVKPATESMTNDQFETYCLEEFLPVFNDAFSSFPISLMKKLKGKRMGEYAEFYVFESLKERNRWWPKPGVSSEETKKGFENLGETWNTYHEKVSGLAYTDYLALPFSGKPIDVQPGNVMAVFEVDFTLEEGMTFEDLEQFYQKEYGPAFVKNFQGTQFCVLKGDRGERAGKYTEMVVFQSMEDYNKWITTDGILTEKGKQAFYNMGEIQTRMEKMYSYENSNYYLVL